MGGKKPVEIICSACGAEALLVRRPKYDGFTKVGESLTCAACGHEYASEEEVPFKHGKKMQIFSDADRSKAVEVFEEHEAEKLCRYCVSYVVNPFMQWCALHKKEVEATDTCDRFEPKPEPENDGEDPPSPRLRRASEDEENGTPGPVTL